MSATCPQCKAPVTVALIAGEATATEPVGDEELFVLAQREQIVCDGRIRGDIAHPKALRAVHRKHVCRV